MRTVCTAIYPQQSACLYLNMSGFVGAEIEAPPSDGLEPTNVHYWPKADMTVCAVPVRPKADINGTGGYEKPRRSGALKSLSLLRGLTSGCWLGRLGRGSLGVLSDAVVDEILPLHEMDGGILLGGLSFARSLDIGRHLLLR